MLKPMTDPPTAGSRPIVITEIEQFGGAERSVLALARWLHHAQSPLPHRHLRRPLQPRAVRHPPAPHRSTPPRHRRPPPHHRPPSLLQVTPCQLIPSSRLRLSGRAACHARRPARLPHPHARHALALQRRRHAHPSGPPPHRRLQPHHRPRPLQRWQHHRHQPIPPRRVSPRLPH